MNEYEKCHKLLPLMTHNDNGPDPDRNYGETAVFIREIEKLSKID